MPGTGHPGGEKFCALGPAPAHRDLTRAGRAAEDAERAARIEGNLGRAARPDPVHGPGLEKEIGPGPLFPRQHPLEHPSCLISVEGGGHAAEDLTLVPRGLRIVSSPPRPESPLLSHRTRVVLIDRGARTSTPLLATLERAGFEVHRHFGAVEAVADFPSTAPDVIVISAEPGTRFAVEAVGAVRLDDLGRLTPVLLVAGKGRAPAGTDAGLHEAGFSALIELPFSDDEFVHAVRDLAEAGLTSPHHVPGVDEMELLDQELAEAMDEIDHEPPPDLGRAAPPSPAIPPQYLPPPPPAVTAPLTEPVFPEEPAFAGGRLPTADELGFHERGPEGIVPREALHRTSTGFRVAPQDPNAQLRMLVTLGAGALLAAAGVGFFVWLLVYTGFNGYEDTIRTVPRIEEDTASGKGSQREREERERGGGQAG